VLDEHRQLARQLGDLAEDHMVNSTASIFIKPTVAFNRGDTFVIGSWVCTADGAGSFQRRLTMPPNPETGLMTLPEVVTGNLARKFGEISLYNQHADFELGYNSNSNSTSPWAIVCESATQPSRVDSPLRERFTCGPRNASRAHAKAPTARRAGKEIIPEYDSDSNTISGYNLDSNPLFGFYSDSSHEFDFGSNPDEPESENNTTEQPLSGPASGLVITSTPAGRFVYWPDRKPADLTGGNLRCVAYLDLLPFQEGTPLALAGEHTPTEVAISDSSLGSPKRQVFMTTNETPGPQEQSLTNISRISQRTSYPPTRPPTRPTPTGTLDVNATESGTNGADVSTSPFPSGTSRKRSTKSRAGCTPPQSNASCLSL
jgi:hypothetical protein